MQHAGNGTAVSERRQGARPGLVLLIASVATFLDFLDVTVVNIAFPNLQKEFPHATLSELSWVVTGYAVVFAALLTPAGRLADVVGRKRVFLTGVSAFTLASLAAAAAPSVPVLIAARAFQGGAAAATIPAALGIVLAVTPPERRTMAIGLWGAAASISAIVGPTLGGLLVEAFDWRAVFLVNLPIGIATVVAGARVLPSLRPGGARLPDIPGTVVLAVALALVIVGVTKGSEWGWTSGATIGCLGGGLALLAAALWRARRHPAPALETSLWRNRVFAAANLTSMVLGAAIYAWLLLCVLFVTTIWHYSVLKAGLSVSPGAFTSAAGAVVAGRMSGTRGARPVVVVGGILLTIDGIWCMLAVSPHPQFLTFWLPAGAFGGLAMGIAMTGVTSAASTSVAPSRFAAGTGLNMTARQLGGALGIATLAAILQAQGPTVHAFRDVFLFCSLAAAASVFCAAGLSSAPAPAPASELEPELETALRDRDGGRAAVAPAHLT
jgi:EmrB/QacA subfamily drug resistance transporter